MGALSKSWWLLVLCGILDAMHAGMNLLMINLPFRFPGFGSTSGVVWDMGLLALTASACVIAAALWSGGKDHSWLLALHGLALGAFGMIVVSPLVKGRLSFRPVSLLFTVMAASLAAFAWASLRTERSVAGRWFLIASGAGSMGFALSFIAVGFRLVRLEPPYSFFIWMSSYFAFSAIVVLWLAFRVHNPRVRQSAPTVPLSPLPNSLLAL